MKLDSLKFETEENISNEIKSLIEDFVLVLLNTHPTLNRYFNSPQQQLNEFHEFIKFSPLKF